jgi:hypothetical protein
MTTKKLSKKLFDLKQGEALKKQGMTRAEHRRKTELEYGKFIARKIALEDPNRTCDADRVQMILIDQGIDLGNAAGMLFREKGEWQWTGEFMKSARKTNHARLLRIWRLL